MKMKSKTILTYAVVLLLAVFVIVNTVMTWKLMTWFEEDRKSLANMECDIQDLKRALEIEMQLREDLFPQLKKSASLLRKYNPRLDYHTALSYACKIYECSDELVSMDVLTALIVVESSANYRAVSHKGAMGLTQVMPRIWKFDEMVLADPYRNIEIGAAILRYYMQRYGRLGGLSAYNSGKRTASLGYARKVLRIAAANF